MDAKTKEALDVVKQAAKEATKDVSVEVGRKLKVGFKYAGAWLARVGRAAASNPNTVVKSI